jgi:hypothetical protein
MLVLGLIGEIQPPHHLRAWLIPTQSLGSLLKGPANREPALDNRRISGVYWLIAGGRDLERTRSETGQCIRCRVGYSLY